MTYKDNKTNFSGFSLACLTLLAIIIVTLCLPFGLAFAKQRVRNPAVAGTFYPKEGAVLKRTVDNFVLNVEHRQIGGKILGLISPHAGYVFSGQVAAYSYREIKDNNYDTVIILGPSHYVYLKGASVGDWDAYATPLGKVPVNKEIVNALLRTGKPFNFVKEAHIREHSVETQIPFLQRVLKNFDIVPIVMGIPCLTDCEKISDTLSKIAEKRNVLFVASSDMSHFPNYTNANKVDLKTLSLIEKFEPELVFNAEEKFLKEGIPNLSTTLCGLSSVVTVMMTAKKIGGNSVKILHYANSGDVAIRGYRERRRVVGYGAAAFYKK